MQKLLFSLIISFYLYGCGGGSSASPSASSKPTAPSSKPTSSSAPSTASSHSSVSSTVVKITETVYHIDINQPITIKTQGDFWLADKNWYQLNLNDPFKSSYGNLAPSHIDNIIYYFPNDNFQGQDEFYYWDLVSSSSPQRIKVVVNVGTEIIKQPHWPVDAQLIFTPATTAEIPMPMDVDSGQFLVIDETAHITLDGKPVSYKAKANNLLIDIPPFERAGIYRLSLQQSGDENAISISTWIQVAIKSGELTYYLGNKDFTGSTLVVVRTNEVDDQEYLTWIKQRLISFLHEPLVRQYQDYWSFVVIEPPAERKINMYGTIGVANAEYYAPYVNQYLPHHTEIIVMDGQPFRATGGYPITMSIFDGHGVLFHEIAHAHAKLGDEYAEDCTFEYHDIAEHPNIEKRFSGTLDFIQWKHWIKDPLSIPGYSIPSNHPTEIGMHLGAYYCSGKYYRPAFSTLMRNLIMPPSVVDKEAWVLANYENLGLLESIVSDRKNGMNFMSVTKYWNPSLTSIRWFLDDKEMPRFNGHREIVITEADIHQDNYSVRAELIDLTGLVVAPHAYYMFNDLIERNINGDIVSDQNSRFTRTFTFNKATAQSPNKVSEKFSDISNNYWAKHSIRIDPQGHTLEHSIVYEGASLTSPLTGASDLLAEIIVNNKIIFTQGVELKQFHFPEQITPFRITQFYNLVHPAIKGSYQIRVYSLPEQKLIATFDLQGN